MLLPNKENTMNEHAEKENRPIAGSGESDPMEKPSMHGEEQQLAGWRKRHGASWGNSQFRSPDPRYKSPFLAAFLSLVPGLGQIYVGYYSRGFLNPFVVGTIMSILVLAADKPGPPAFYVPLGIIFMVFFWLYNIIDAWRRATMYNLALEGLENIPLPDDMSTPRLGGSLFGGVVLVLGGLAILLHTRFDVPIEVYEQWWPIAPVAMGAYLIIRSQMDKKQKNEIDAG
jgi:TM2 domain-containing membrane protein YozV